MNLETSTVSSNIGKTFLKIVSKHFPRQHKYHTLFNKNNIKVSYSCMENIGAIISKHNKKILSNNDNNDIPNTSLHSPTENFLTALNYQSTSDNSKTATSISQLNGLSSQELDPTIIQVNDVTYAWQKNFILSNTAITIS